ncbi:serine palmitoyltransferase small subunit family protein [Sporobolomyces koalae]|uniref:serine palmitoyltransferase small subunit family protein n=1 Tax=Sporobolomyces koalae TaxID=500713 RepID=UPI00317776AF
MPKASSSKLYQRTKALLTPPSSPPTSKPSPLETSPSSKMTKTTVTTIAEHPESTNRVVEAPKSNWKPPKKIGVIESWWIFYEGMFAGSMLETWEKVLLHSILVIFLTLMALAASYLPGHLRVIASHARYYAYGTGEYSPR